MRYFILGYDTSDCLIFMTRRIFTNEQEAKEYIKNISPAWKSFIVGEIK